MLKRMSGIFKKKEKPKAPTAAEPKGPAPNPKIPNVIPNRNGFFQALSLAYNKHHILVLRPDDVWLAILVQFNFFVNIFV